MPTDKRKIKERTTIRIRLEHHLLTVQAHQGLHGLISYFLLSSTVFNLCFNIIDLLLNFVISQFIGFLLEILLRLTCFYGYLIHQSKPIRVSYPLSACISNPFTRPLQMCEFKGFSFYILLAFSISLQFNSANYIERFENMHHSKKYYIPYVLQFC